ncbi:MAG: ribosome biogenesis GTPase Der [Gemmatimonadales bacterium]|nr:ribosome biogenesis GTPase Der [Gemmatimonadales bacterium]NIN11989.1 ribosome biogenesis GTPase Der [Gemmatimonadales bacterium]NIN50524.1 ribosome biogenesis GTPase Der [Gemmatimonadales bacterium]NIP07988.1 ribosome biogenesis GTPase Der [Gemmatimonadales bacterium]NIR00579.1 ribosome biogenesis GTPase Der [Gemmatimonadales bacterium]
MRRATVAIVGRPNVGKSTLFNRIVGGRRAIVDDRPGVTRDRHFATSEWGGKHFWLVDTGGWFAGEDDALHSGIRQQIQLAIEQSDAVVFVVDTNAGVHPVDLEVAQLLRTHGARVVVAANKADDLPNNVSHLAFHELGLGDPQPVSAAQGTGSGDLLDRIVALLPEAPEQPPEGLINVAVVGRPNVGKSSLVNRLLGEERSVVAPEAGTTRDAVDSPLRYHGRTLNFIDTAGLRKRSKVEDEIEFYSALRSERAIEQADVCVLVVDATSGLHAQDLKIAQAAWERGAALIVAVTKWDLIDGKDTTTAIRGEQQVAQRAPFLRAVPFVYVSGLTGLRARKILDLILDVAAARERRIATAEVNRALEALVARNQPPQRGGQEVKLYYGSQVAITPPTFAIVTNHPEAIPESYRRYLEHGFRETWEFAGAPIRIKFRRKRGRR